MVSFAPGLHSPWPWQPDQPDHWQFPPQLRLCVPQLPQFCSSIWPDEHGPWPWHPDHPLHWHWAVHVRTCFPQLPQGMFSFWPGSHAFGMPETESKEQLPHSVHVSFVQTSPSLHFESVGVTGQSKLSEPVDLQLTV